MQESTTMTDYCMLDSRGFKMLFTHTPCHHAGTHHAGRCPGNSAVVPGYGADCSPYQPESSQPNFQLIVCCWAAVNFNSVTLAALLNCAADPRHKSAKNWYFAAVCCCCHWHRRAAVSAGRLQCDHRQADNLLYGNMLRCVEACTPNPTDLKTDSPDQD